MGDDPETSVTNECGAVHEVSGLGIMDGATFPTSLGMNPTTTIMAVAARSVLHLIETRAKIAS
ncbi:MAG: hypothetical protein JJT81_01220 [Rubellimicrobium sp.]|nr:hypothetical protein [Rubellimicrobium sp.]